MRASPITWLGGGLIAALLLVAVFAPLLAPFDPKASSGLSLQPPSADHLLGTNDVGQDILSQLLWGARATLLVALPAAALAVSAGVLVGAGSRLLGGWAEVVTMRIVDALLALPALPLLILVATLTGPSRSAVIVVVALAGWPQIARVVRSETASLGGRGYVRAARGFGAGPAWSHRTALRDERRAVRVDLARLEAEAAADAVRPVAEQAVGDPDRPTRISMPAFSAPSHALLAAPEIRCAACR